MHTEHPAHFLSPLSQHIERDGLSVRVDIYGDGHGQWILEVVDDGNNSTVWDEAFETDQAAFDEVMGTIDSDGIRTLVGTPPDQPI